ncbi:MAG: hemerythrin domain-containing protein [bacterium]|nr:hemerythrin domain-containing protein [bacterium]
MTNLIDELKRGHIEISDTFNRIRKLGIASEESRALLISARSGLLAHLKKEDEQLYPALKKEAENDSSLKRVLDTFAKDMEAISQTVMVFFDKSIQGEPGLEFAREFGRLFAVLSQRIGREEMIIYKKYEEIEQRKSANRTTIAQNARDRRAMLNRRK